MRSDLATPRFDDVAPGLGAEVDDRRHPDGAVANSAPGEAPPRTGPPSDTDREADQEGSEMEREKSHQVPLVQAVWHNWLVPRAPWRHPRLNRIAATNRAFLTVKSNLAAMNTNLRPFDIGDSDAVVALALRAWEPVHTSMAEVLGRDINAHVYPDWRASQERDVRRACAEQIASVATTDQAIVGFVTVLIEGSEKPGEIYMIAVDPVAQRTGVGRALTEHALGQIREAGCQVAVVGTGGDRGHAPARALYESCGFTALPLVNYYRLL
jgi:ribosomal protein S18 acetylase RimI-like enzyme